MKILFIILFDVHDFIFSSAMINSLKGGWLYEKFLNLNKNNNLNYYPYEDELK